MPIILNTAMNEETKSIFLAKYEKAGNEQFYDFLVSYGTNRINNANEIKGATPEVELMNYYEQFLTLFRITDEKIYIDIARVFRRASHKIYLLMVKKEMIRRSDKFLNLVG